MPMRMRCSFCWSQVRITVAQHARESLVTLGDFTGATVDHAVATKLKEVLTLDRPFVKKTAWVGTDSIPHAFMENFESFSQREIVTFKTREDAMDWLVGESFSVPGSQFSVSPTNSILH